MTLHGTAIRACSFDDNMEKMCLRICDVRNVVSACGHEERKREAWSHPRREDFIYIAIARDSCADGAMPLAMEL